MPEMGRVVWSDPADINADRITLGMERLDGF